MEKFELFFLGTKIGILITILTVLSLLVWAIASAGIFKGLRVVLHDWAMDHTTGKYTINNGARILLLFAFLFVFIAVHFTITLKPFHIQPVPLTELEIFFILGAIMGLTWVNRPNMGSFGSTKTEISTEGPTTINTAPQAAKPAPVKEDKPKAPDADLDGVIIPGVSE